MFVRILTACKRGVNGGGSSCLSRRSERRRASPFAPSSPKRPSLWRRRAPPSTDHASQWRGDLCEPIAPSQLKAPKFGRPPWHAVGAATATVGRSTRWLERFYCSGPIPIPNRNSKPVQSPPNLFQLELYHHFHDVDATPSSRANNPNERDEGIASTSMHA